jgi:hypothetical protein
MTHEIADDTSDTSDTRLDNSSEDREDRSDNGSDSSADQASQEQVPTGTASPSVVPIQNPGQPSFGWNAYAERTNGRFAMVGFVLLLVLEWFTQQDFFTWLGLR